MIKIKKTRLDGVFVIEPRVFQDNRGIFYESYSKRIYQEAGIDVDFVQDNHSVSQQGTLRGLHYQASPYEEAKLVRCTKGGIFDVMVDLREGSPTYGKWMGAELTADNRRMLLVPEGFAHGFQTLQDDTEVFYQVSEFYTANAEKGARYDDPAFGITWPLEVSIISDKDANWPAYSA